MKVTFDWPDEVPQSEFSHQFIQGMLNRMAMSYFKYGLVKQAHDRGVLQVESLLKRLDLYVHDGNTEWLMDVANVAMIEFMGPHGVAIGAEEDGTKIIRHFRATDSAESPGRVIPGKETVMGKSNPRLSQVHNSEID